MFNVEPDQSLALIRFPKSWRQRWGGGGSDGGAGVVRRVVAASFAISWKVLQDLKKDIYCGHPLHGPLEHRGSRGQTGASTSSDGIFLRCVRRCWGRPIPVLVWMVTEPLGCRFGSSAAKIQSLRQCSGYLV